MNSLCVEKLCYCYLLLIWILNYYCGRNLSFDNYFLSKIDAEQLILILLQIESKFSYCQKNYQFMDGVALDMGS